MGRAAAARLRLRASEKATADAAGPRDPPSGPVIGPSCGEEATTPADYWCGVDGSLGVRGFKGRREKPVGWVTPPIPLIGFGGVRKENLFH